MIAKARGKELRLHLKSVNEDLSETGECVDVTFGHGLVGQWCVLFETNTMSLCVFAVPHSLILDSFTLCRMSASNASSLSLPKGALVCSMFHISPNCSFISFYFLFQCYSLAVGRPTCSYICMIRYVEMWENERRVERTEKRYRIGSG